jgi:hypothetical protein
MDWGINGGRGGEKRVKVKNDDDDDDDDDDKG